MPGGARSHIHWHAGPRPAFQLDGTRPWRLPPRSASAGAEEEDRKYEPSNPAAAGAGIRFVFEPQRGEVVFEVGHEKVRIEEELASYMLAQMPETAWRLPSYST